MIKEILTVSILTIFTSAFSQKNYIPAKVITFEGDTLTGQIDYRNPDSASGIPILDLIMNRLVQFL